MKWIVGIWSIIVLTLYISAFALPQAASFERFTRLIYMLVLALSIIAAAISFLRPQHGSKE